MLKPEGKPDHSSSEEQSWSSDKKETRVSSLCGHAVLKRGWGLKSCGVFKNHFYITETHKKGLNSLGDAFTEPQSLENSWETCCVDGLYV